MLNALLVFLLIPATVFSQAPAAKRLEFEVASVTLSTTSSTAGNHFDPEMGPVGGYASSRSTWGRFHCRITKSLAGQVGLRLTVGTLKRSPMVRPRYLKVRHVADVDPGPVPLGVSSRNTEAANVFAGYREGRGPNLRQLDAQLTVTRGVIEGKGSPIALFAVSYRASWASR